jgi:pimeloyl-ACP methyl ester carboxylesterase
MMRGAGISRRGVLGAAGALALGALQLKPAQAAAPMHRSIETNGIKLHVVEQGTGPVVVLCHGFPECWYSWRHQIQALADAGFRAVAPDMRGYGRSDAPREADKYTLVDYVGDIVGLLDGLGVDQAVVAGHDFGATVAWEVALMRPDRFRGVIALGVPFRSRGFGTPVRPTSVMPRTDDAVYYQLYLQTPEAQAQFDRDLRLTFRSLFFALSGDAPRPAAGGAQGVAAMGMVPRKSGPVLVDPASLPQWTSEADIDFYVEEFRRRGFGAPLNWYRNIDRSWELLGTTQGAKVTVPALFIAGERDFVVAANERFVASQSAFVPKLRPAVMLPGCGHWTQQERAPEVNAAMIDFLRRLPARQ